MNKHLYLVLSTIALVGLGFLLFFLWEEIVHNQSLFGFSTALIGALVGGIVGGLGSYYGGIKGAEISFEKHYHVHKRHATKAVLTLLSYSYEIFSNLPDDDDSILTGDLLYDVGWVDHLSYLDFLDKREFSKVVFWMNKLQIITDIKEKDGVSVKVSYVRPLLGESLPYIKEIIDKIDQHLE